MKPTAISFPIESIETIFGTAKSRPRGKRSMSRVDDGGKTLTLGGALRRFIEINPHAHQSQISAVAAGDNNISLVKQFCAFLVKHDFDAEVLVGVGYRKKLVKPCPQLIAQMAEEGAPYVHTQLKHPVVKVNSVVIDLCFLRLGDSYEQSNSFSLKQFNEYWKETRNMADLMAITPEVAKRLAESQPGFAQARRHAMASAAPMIHWFIYDSSVPASVYTTHGERVLIVKGEYFSVKESTRTEDLIFVATHPEKNIRLAITKSNALMRRSKAVLGAPTTAIKSPQQIQIPMKHPSKDDVPKSRHPNKSDPARNDSEYDDVAQPATPSRVQIPVSELPDEDTDLHVLPFVRSIR